ATLAAALERGLALPALLLLERLEEHRLVHLADPERGEHLAEHVVGGRVPELERLPLGHDLGVDEAPHHGADLLVLLAPLAHPGLLQVPGPRWGPAAATLPLETEHLVRNRAGNRRAG